MPLRRLTRLGHELLAWLPLVVVVAAPPLVSAILDLIDPSRL